MLTFNRFSAEYDKETGLFNVHVDSGDNSLNEPGDFTMAEYLELLGYFHDVLLEAFDGEEVTIRVVSD